MPMVLPAIAAAAASYAVTTYAVTVAAYGAFASAVAGAVAGYVASAAVGAIVRPDAPDISAGLTQPGGARTFSFRQPTASHPVVVGRIKTSGPVMFMHSKADDTGRADGYFYLQIALAGHRVKRIGDLYIHDDLATDSKFDDLVTIGRHRGTSTQTEDPLFLADIGADFANHWLRGRANIAVRLKGRATAFPNGLPNLSAIVWGADEIYDPRTGLTGWTNNAALIVAWWHTWAHGLQLPWSRLNEPALIAAANVCDERVRTAGSTVFTAVPADAGSPTVYSGYLTLAAGARNLDVGDGIRVSSSGALPSGLSAGVTYYAIPSDGGTLGLATSVVNAFNEVAIMITDAGSGTLTLTYWDEARYKCNGMFTLNADKMQIRDHMLSSMAGYAVELGGKWSIHAGAPATATVTLTADDLRGGMSEIPKRSMRDRFNGMRAVFVSADNYWQPSDAPPLVPTAAYLAEDNGRAIYEDVRLPFTTSARAAMRLMKIYRERNRRQGTWNFPAKLTAMKLSPLAGCYIDYERFGLAQAQHIVTGWGFAEDGGIDLQLQEDDATIYDWSSAEELTVSAPQDVTLPDPSAIDAPATVTVTTPLTSEYNHLEAQWSEVSSIWLTGYDVEYRDSGAVDWIGYGRVGRDIAREVSVERSTPQDFRVRAVTDRTQSVFTEALAPGAPIGVTGGAGTISWTNVPEAAAVQIFAADDSLYATTIFDSESLPADTYRLRTIDAQGNVSALTAGTVVT